MDDNYLSMKSKIKQEKKLAKLNKKYSHLNNFIKQKEQVVEKPKPNSQQVNVGYLSSKKLKDKLEKIEIKTIPITKKNKNRNGKVGIVKNNNHTPDKRAPRKVCCKYGSSNHLAMQCKNGVPPIFSQSIPANVDQNFSGFPKIPFLPNPFYICGMQACHLCHGEHQFLITHLHIHILKNARKRYSHPKASVKSKGQRSTPKVKVDLTSYEYKAEKPVTQPKVSTNKPGPKTIWVPI